MNATMFYLISLFLCLSQITLSKQQKEQLAFYGDISIAQYLKQFCRHSNSNSVLILVENSIQFDENIRKQRGFAKSQLMEYISKQKCTNLHLFSNVTTE